MAGTFNTISTTEVGLKLLELIHTAEIITKPHIKQKNQLGIIFNFENKTITFQEVFILLYKTTRLYNHGILYNQRKSPRLKKSKRIKQILYAEYKQINLKTIVVNMNYRKDKNKSLL